MDTHGIPLYRLIKKMGLDPTVCQSNWHKKVRGELPISQKESLLLLNTLEDIVGKPVDSMLFAVDKFRCI